MSVKDAAGRATARAVGAFKGLRLRSVERLLLFTGYARSGSTLLGALLNAHPQVLVAYEAGMLSRVDANTTRGDIAARLAGADWRERRTGYRHWGYSYAVRNQWQGRVRHASVIGDKQCNGNTVALYAQPQRLQLLRRQWKVRNLFLYRNPYDMVATGWLNVLRDRAGFASGMAAGKALRSFAPTEAERPQCGQSAISDLFARSDKLAEVLSLFAEEETLAIGHEDFVTSPRRRLREICDFLDLAYTEEWLDACVAIVFPTPHRSRFKVRWAEDQLQAVATAIGRYHWLAGYGYDTVPVGAQRHFGLSAGGTKRRLK